MKLSKLYARAWMCLFLLCCVETIHADETPFSLQDASRLALENSYDIQLLKYDLWEARLKKDAVGSIYDTLLKSEVMYHKDQRQNVSTISGSKSISNDYNVSLLKKVPTGTTFSVGMTNNRNFSNSPFLSSSLTHDSSLGVGVTQSLGQNFFGILDRGEIKITEQEVLHSDFTSFERMEDFLSTVQVAYWDLVAVTKKKIIEDEMVGLSKDLLDSMKEKLLDGLIEQAEYLAADANYQLRLNSRDILENDIKSKSNVLRLMLNLSDSDSKIILKDEMLIQEQISNAKDALVKAFEHRYDYKAKKAEVDIARIRLELAKNERWPQIDLNASIRRNGLGDHFKQSSENIYKQDHPDFMASLLINFPLENTKAKVQYKEAKLRKARLLIELKLLERKIVLGVTDQWRDVQVLMETVRSRELIAQLQSQKLEEENKRFKYGRSSIDQIIRFQEDLLHARQMLIDAKKNFMVSLIGLERQQGLLLRRYLFDDFLKVNDENS